MKKTIIITGASSGLGAELARRFAKENHTVCALARSVDKLNNLNKEYPENIYPFPVDISSEQTVKDTFNAIKKQFKTVDLLINNAAYVCGGGVVGEDNLSEAYKVIDINLKGAMYCCYAVIPLMVEKQSGRIINISSIAALPGGPMSIFQKNPEEIKAGAYGISKAGMNAIGEMLGQSLQSNNITMTTIMPGAIDTPVWIDEKGNNRHPMKEDGAKLMKTSEVADLISFIAAQPNHICYKSVTLFPICEWK